MRDYEILDKHFDVTYVVVPNEEHGWLEYITNLKREIKRSDLVFVWKAGWHSAIALVMSRIYRKKILVVIGGHDIACVPEINFGAFAKRHFLRERLPAKYVLKHADMLLPFSKSVDKEMLERVTPRKYTLVYCGISDMFISKNNDKEDIVITVAYMSKDNIKRKGIDVFIETARWLPDVPFVVIGGCSDNSIESFKRVASSNVTFTGFLTDDELARWYQRAKIYAQLSVHEGFGISVAEAMLSECIPVITRNYSLPEVVGNTGFYVSNNPKNIADVIKRVLGYSGNRGAKARERIESNFLLKRREDKLVEVIKSLK